MTKGFVLIIRGEVSEATTLEAFDGICSDTAARLDKDQRVAVETWTAKLGGDDLDGEM